MGFEILITNLARSFMLNRLLDEDKATFMPSMMKSCAPFPLSNVCKYENSFGLCCWASFSSSSLKAFFSVSNSAFVNLLGVSNF